MAARAHNRRHAYAFEPLKAGCAPTRGSSRASPAHRIASI